MEEGGGGLKERGNREKDEQPASGSTGSEPSLSILTMSASTWGQ